MQIKTCTLASLFAISVNAYLNSSATDTGALRIVPNPVPLTVTFPVDNGGAVVADTSGNTRVFYQSSNGAIHMLSGVGNTDTKNYQDSQILPSGIAVAGSPFAAVSYRNDLSAMRLYFIGVDTHLKEYLYTTTTGWNPGGLNNAFGAGFGANPTSKYLWALVDSTGKSRIGFLANTNILMEVWDTTTGWKGATAF